MWVLIMMMVFSSGGVHSKSLVEFSNYQECDRAVRALAVGYPTERMGSDIVVTFLCQQRPTEKDTTRNK